MCNGISVPHIPSVNPSWTKHCNISATRKNTTPSIRLQRNTGRSYNYIMWNMMKNSCSGIKVDGGCKAFALTGRKGCMVFIPRALPWARSFYPFRACGANPRHSWSFCLLPFLLPVTVGSGRVATFYAHQKLSQ